MTESTPDLRGAELGGITLKERIGSGAMGEVWLGRDADLEIDVAVKVLPARLAQDPFFVMSFIQEARAIARINHNNVVRVLQAGKREWQGQTFRILVMEFVRGKNLRELLLDHEDGRLPEEEVAEIVLGVAEGLRAAHRLGIVHRDIKPANIVMPDEGGGAKIIDFGIAWERRDEDRPDFQAGSPTYMAPELFGDEAVDQSIDVYALGVSLYELLCGQAPFVGSASTVRKGHLNKPVDLGALQEMQFSESWKTLILGMCEKEPSARLSLKEVEAQLKAIQGVSTSAIAQASTDNRERFQTNLVSRGTSFVGRSSELGRLKESFSASSRLVSVLGTGGVGKTRLAHEFGIQTQNYPGGVFFCDLTEAQDSDSIASEVANALRLKVADNPKEQVASALKLRGARTLLIVDNFEHLTEFAEESIGEWRRSAPNVHFLVTSREPLHLEGETPFVLKPLACGEESDDAALRLFAERAATAVGSFVLDTDNRREIAEICKHLDGIPLAIELAAARTTVLSPKQILERLPQRFDLLRSRRKDQSRRQMTLHAAIQWSWDLLNAAEQSALMQCAIFRGGFFLEAAESIIDVGEFEDAPFAIDIIESLVEKNLIATEDVSALPSEIRYRLLESIRQFAELQWEQMAQEESQVRLDNLTGRHAEYYLKYSEAWGRKTTTPQGFVAIQRLELATDNLLAIQDRFSNARHPFAARAILAAVRGLRNKGLAHVLINRLEAGAALLDGSDPDLSARVFITCGRAHTDFGSREKAQSYLEDAIELVDGINGHREKEALVHALQERAWLDMVRGDFEEAYARYEKARRLASSIQYWDGVAKSLRSMGGVHSNRGEFDPALQKYSEAAKIFRRIGDLQGEVNVLSNLGTLYSRQGRLNEALETYLKAEIGLKKLRDRSDIATHWGNLGIAYAELGEVDKALDFYAKSEELFRSLGERAGVARNVANRGNILADRGETRAAMDCYRESEAIHRDMGNQFGIAIDVGNIGYLHVDLKEADAAWACFEEAESISRELGSMQLLRVWLHGKAQVSCFWRHDPKETIRVCEELLETIDALHFPEDSVNFSALAILAKSYSRLAASESESDAYAEKAKDYASQAKQLGDRLDLDRISQSEPNSGEVHHGWRYIEEILGVGTD